MKVYMAGSLFSLAETRFNKAFAQALGERMPDVQITLPQEFDPAEARPDEQLEAYLFRRCIGAIDEVDVVLAILDGPDADSGTCIELGYAYARGVPIVGLRTDFRALEEGGLNLMVARVCRELVYADVRSESFESAADKAAEALRRLA
jgi:nucleoside 2-deoxyribosyltransferase